MTDEVLCTVCEQGKEAHGKDSGKQHPFTGPDQPEWIPPKTQKQKPGGTAVGHTPRGQVLVAPMPDLALRHALVKAKLLTPEQLEEAEHDLRIGGSNTYRLPPDQAGS